MWETAPPGPCTAAPLVLSSVDYYMVTADCFCLARRQDGRDLLSLSVSCIRCVWLRDELRLLSPGLSTVGGCRLPVAAPVSLGCLLSVYKT